MQFEEYLQKQLLAIENLEERKAMRKIFESVLIPLQKHCDEKCNALAEKVTNEKGDSARFTIYTGLIERQNYDVTTEHMLPMKREDLLEKKINLSTLASQLLEEQQANLFTIYLKLSRGMIQKLIDAERFFQGIIKTDAGEFPARFYLKQNREYLQMVRDLYPVFVKNGVEWNTVCAPYLYKFFDVYIVQAEEMEGEEIEEISIDFEEYKEFVAYDLIPIWNLEVVSQRTNSSAKPCIDRIHYEHMVFKERLGAEQYLVMNQDMEILNQRRIDGDLYITCEASEDVNWKLLKFHNWKDTRWKYPIMGNECEQINNKVIRTKAAMEKFIFALGYESYVELAEILVEEKELQNSEIRIPVEKVVQLLQRL